MRTKPDNKKTIDNLNRSIGLFSSKDEAVCLKGSFVDLICFMPNSEKGIESDIWRNIQYIHQDLWNLASIIYRLDQYIKSRNTDPERFMSDWLIFTRLDIDHFHVEFRSILDYVAQSITCMANKPGAVKDKSLIKMINWVNKDKGNEKRLGEDLSLFIRSMDWAEDVIYIRDSIVHFGENILVFDDPTQNGILFQYFGGTDYKRKKIDLSPAMFNERVVRFEHYSALFFSYLLCSLEDFAVLFYKKVNPKMIGSNATANYHGLNIIRNWIIMMRDKMTGKMV